jgi:ribosomal-protein-alanine N-acetyltransferase
MKSKYITPRLLLNELNLSDAKFILELVNSPEWIKFIGDRNINTDKIAKEYIRKIMDDPAISFWTVRTRDQAIPMGIITFIKRDYLDYRDIGFAFLPQYAGQGYAYEATVKVLNDILRDLPYSQVLATTVKENFRSINLLQKLGFQFESRIQNKNEMLLLYSISKD